MYTYVVDEHSWIEVKAIGRHSTETASDHMRACYAGSDLDKAEAAFNAPYGDFVRGRSLHFWIDGKPIMDGIDTWNAPDTQREFFANCRRLHK